VKIALPKISRPDKLRGVSSPAHRRFFPLAAWLLLCAWLCGLLVPARVEAMTTAPAKIASWGAGVSASGRLSDPSSVNQDGIRVGEPCDYESVSGLPEWLSRDPIAESGGINLYGYVGNNPVSETDPLGLSPADVARLQTVSSGLIYQMTVDGQRLASWIWGPAGGYLGNIIQTPQDLFDAATGRPLRNYQQGSWSCQSQAQNIQDRLEPFLQPGWLDDTWTATQVQNDSNTHVWIQLNSSNPGDPVIVVDPFKGRVNAK
jgi:hypothetical protein